MKKTPIMKNISKVANNEEGYIMMMGLFVMMILILMGIALAVMGIQEFELASRVKMMDQAYLIADAGVNSAAVALETNAVAKETKTPVFPDTGGSGILTGTTPFGGGEFTYTVYQSNEFPDDAGYKVIKSKGTIEKQGKKVERIILARILLPAGGLDYDASFDYLMFNGMDSNGDGTSEHGLWAPTDLRFGSLAIGNFTFDGSASFQGHSPKGAFYVDGSMEIPTSILGDVFLKGNIVAMDNIDLSNTWGLNTSDNGIKVSLGNVVAGLDGSGYATVTATKGMITGASAINISGNVCAPGDVTVTGNTTVSFNNPVVVGGIRTGGRAIIDAKWTVAQPLQVTNGIIAVKDIDIQSNALSGVSVTGGFSAGGEDSVSLWAGQNSTTGLGVNLQTTVASLSVGNIRSNGKVKARTIVAGIGLGRITAGNDTSSDTGGLGVDIDIDFIPWSDTNGDGSIDWNEILAPLSIGKITTAGEARVDCSILSKINIAGIDAGSNAGDTIPNTGVKLTGSGFSEFAISDAVNSVGHVIVNNSDGTKLTTRSIWSGGSINLNGSATWLTDIGDNSITMTASSDVPVIQSVGSTTISSADSINISGNDVKTIGALTITCTKPGLFSGDAQVDIAVGNSIYSGSTTTITNNNSLLNCSSKIGNIYSLGNVDVYIRDPLDVDNVYAGNSSTVSTLKLHCDANFALWGNDSYAGDVWGTGKVTLTHRQTLTGDFKVGHIKSASVIRMEPNGDAGWGLDIDTIDYLAPNYEMEDGKSWGNVDPSTWDLGGYHPTATGNPGSITGVVSPSVSTPTQPAKPAKPVLALPTDATTGDVNMLREAGLSKPVKILRPNWSYFETLAEQNDIANGPETKICSNLACRLTVASTNPGEVPATFPDTCPYCTTNITAVYPGPAHMIYEGGPGDDEPGTAGIQFVWDDTKPYSSNETVYNGDPAVNIFITVINWNPAASTYTGTIVSKGNIYIAAGTTTFFIHNTQNLNIVSGWDIENRSDGFSLIHESGAQLHLWAAHDINFDYMNISLYANNDFRGSFTAGNEVKFNSNAIFEDSTFSWSRWALDPVAWAPPFKVLDWKEL